jgi:hypothetical protein
MVGCANGRGDDLISTADQKFSGPGAFVLLRSQVRRRALPGTLSLSPMVHWRSLRWSTGEHAARTRVRHRRHLHQTIPQPPYYDPWLPVIFNLTTLVRPTAIHLSRQLPATRRSSMTRRAPQRFADPLNRPRQGHQARPRTPVHTNVSQREDWLTCDDALRQPPMTRRQCSSRVSTKAPRGRSRGTIRKAPRLYGATGVRRANVAGRCAPAVKHYPCR